MMRAGCCRAASIQAMFRTLADEWNDDLRRNFINGFMSFVDFIKFMHVKQT